MKDLTEQHTLLTLCYTVSPGAGEIVYQRRRAQTEGQHWRGCEARPSRTAEVSREGGLVPSKEVHVRKTTKICILTFLFTSYCVV